MSATSCPPPMRHPVASVISQEMTYTHYLKRESSKPPVSRSKGKGHVQNGDMDALRGIVTRPWLGFTCMTPVCATVSQPISRILQKSASTVLQ